MMLTFVYNLSVWADVFKSLNKSGMDLPGPMIML